MSLEMNNSEDGLNNARYDAELSDHDEIENNSDSTAIFEVAASSESEDNHDEITDSPKRKRKSSESPVAKRQKSEDDSDGHTCPICFEHWTSSGDHRLCALKCGHLVGYSCIQKWLVVHKQNHCPTCKTKSQLKDIRFLYAQLVKMTDTSEITELQTKLSTCIREKDELNSQYQTLLRRNAELQKKIWAQQLELRNSKPISTSEQTTVPQFNFVCALELSKETSVMAYNSIDLLVVAVKLAVSAFGQYGIRKLSTADFTGSQVIPLHSKPIKDMVFHPKTGELLLTVSSDMFAKITNVHTKTIVETFPSSYLLGACCWDAVKPNLFYVGGQQGKITQFDLSDKSATREIDLSATEPPVGCLISTGDSTVVAVSLRSCWSVKFNETIETKLVAIDGPFVTMNYNVTTKQFLFTTRRNAKHLTCQQTLYNTGESNEELTLQEVQTFEAGFRQIQWAKNCQMQWDGDIYLACHRPANNMLDIWSAESGSTVQSISVPDTILDMCYIPQKKQLVLLHATGIKVYVVE